MAMARQRNDSTAHHKHMYQANFKKNWLLKLATSRKIVLSKAGHGGKYMFSSLSHCHTCVGEVFVGHFGT